MPLRKETMIENAFTVDSIVTILYLKWENADYIKNSDNIYDFWQLLYLDCGHYTFQIGGKTLSLGTGQLMLCEPGKVRHSLDHTDVSIAIISFRCHSAKIDVLKNQSITLSDEQRKHLSHILTVGTERFKTIPENQKYFGQEPEADTADYELQTIKNRLELLLIDMYESRNSPQKVMPVPQNQVNYYEQQFKRIERYMIVNINKNLTIAKVSCLNLLYNLVHDRRCLFIRYNGFYFNLWQQINRKLILSGRSKISFLITTSHNICDIHTIYLFIGFQSHFVFSNRMILFYLDIYFYTLFHLNS